ncbi:MAG: glycerate kinase [Rhodospirillaceae bacterium]|nr:glycerate kinase [Rhodospirillaceae bacterium]
MTDPKAVLRELFDAAVGAANPLKCVPPHLPTPPKGRTVVIGAGKASAAMAQAVEAHWPDDRRAELSGLVITRYDYGKPCEHIEIVEAAHPVPDQAGADAARRLMDLVGDLNEDDLCLALISGGASSLLTLPADGLTLEDKQAVNRALLRSGATITEMNCVRKHLSAIKGGRLAAAVQPARLVSLLISDVPGDDPGVIGSGPTVPDPTTYADAREIITRYGVKLPKSAAEHLAAGGIETPKPDDRVFRNTELRMIARPAASLEAAEKAARDAGFNVLTLGDALEGEARDVAAQHAELAVLVKNGNGPVQTPAVILSGGELTVTMTGQGRGGPNGEYMLAMAQALEGADGIFAMACDTDGIDGSEDNAGAMISPDTLNRAGAAGLDLDAFLADNDSYGFFAALDDLVMTGPTYTNVNDFRALLVLS